MTLSVDLFFSFRSPYSYLALPKTLKLVEDYDLAVNLRPVYPLAVRVPGFFKKANPQFARYVVRDSTRVAEYEGIPFRFPRPDPIVSSARPSVAGKGRSADRRRQSDPSRRKGQFVHRSQGVSVSRRG
jgi:2-hydroxychromene-2-carboxylate isomerase